MKILLTFVFVISFQNACTKDSPKLTDNIIFPDPGSQEQPLIKYLALGDSYTIGESVEVNERWPVQLADSLSATGFNMDEAEIIAQTGWTTGELKQAIASQGLQDTFHLVTLLIGVNNQYRQLDTAEYRTEFRELLQTAIKFAGGASSHVIVVSIPDYGVNPFAQTMDTEKIAEEIDAFNAIKSEETIKAGVEFVNVTPVSRMAGDDPSLVADDGLHPSGKMYTEWVKLIFPVALQVLENKTMKK